MRFVCDQMLVGLGKWLRAAGYDTIIIETSIPDQQILEYALNEERLLLTRDAHFLKMKTTGETVIFLRGNSIKECIQELNERLNIDWLLDPFSRCLVCNSKLTEADYQTILEQVPADVLLKSTLCFYCLQCKKVYWKGSHTKRMLDQLNNFSL